MLNMVQDRAIVSIEQEDSHTLSNFVISYGFE